MHLARPPPFQARPNPHPELQPPPSPDIQTEFSPKFFLLFLIFEILHILKYTPYRYTLTKNIRNISAYYTSSIITDWQFILA